MARFLSGGEVEFLLIEESVGFNSFTRIHADVRFNPIFSTVEKQAIKEKQQLERLYSEGQQASVKLPEETFHQLKTLIVNIAKEN